MRLAILRIAGNSNFLDNLSAENLERLEVEEVFLPAKELVMHLTYKDVWLDYFVNRQQFISPLRSGDDLIWNGKECLNSNGQSVLRFSKNFLQEIENLKEKNFILKSVRVNFILYWLKEGTELEVKIILPELVFEKCV